MKYSRSDGDCLDIRHPGYCRPKNHSTQTFLILNAGLTRNKVQERRGYVAATIGQSMRFCREVNQAVPTCHLYKHKQAKRKPDGKRYPRKKREKEAKTNITHICGGPAICIRSMYRLNDAGSRLHDHAKREGETERDRRMKERENVITCQSCRQR